MVGSVCSGSFVSVIRCYRRVVFALQITGNVIVIGADDFVMMYVVMWVSYGPVNT